LLVEGVFSRKSETSTGTLRSHARGGKIKRLGKPHGFMKECEPRKREGINDPGINFFG
jgi:hypothetical protein